MNKEEKELSIKDAKEIISILLNDETIYYLLKNRRDADIVYKILSGKKHQDIADDLGLSIHSIKSIYRKSMNIMRMSLAETLKRIGQQEQIQKEVSALRMNNNAYKEYFDELNKIILKGHVIGINGNLPVDDLDLSVRAFNCIKAAKIETLYELAGMTEYELLRFRNFGKKSIEEIRELLKEHGLTFKQ